MNSDNPLRSLSDLSVDERQAVIEKLAMTLERDADWAEGAGDSNLGSLMRSVATAMFSSAWALATTEDRVSEDIAVRALGLIMAFHSRHPSYPIEPVLH